MYVDILLLAELTSGPKYGYEIKKNIQNRLGENFELNHNMLYPSLRRFENMGAITKKVHTQVGKPNRNMYDITETGEEIFSEMLREFPEKLATNNIEFLVRIALFEKLDYEARKEVLTIRQDILHKQLTAIQSLDASSFFITEVIEFSKSRIEHELLWITSLMKKI
ncbi:PadR family transcriptional regulator [Bacillus tropicus]|uniref:Transcriptional regulator PadR-like family protein n=2 Tax=Bacillus cereus group TaxID=86661 RepID=A0A9X8SQU4_9BACI|nr:MULTISPECIES: PadR family transcriptional regulator [Bacillus]ALL24119.1 PadR family transcriptional regulator [Bacillus thuringiensis]ATI52924.1 PadR family transcriptional regulator [Bacillus cereus]EEM22412.1 Transcriptional regulator, PadR family domain protein [Bacillus thuringiensis serovar tochigiensis BGSC 4Y1]KMQ00396.1 PadR family transcriptional regulator [Bacillus cereus]MBR9743186.1 PadR family transcriptional regulator [Bacillus cereus]